MTIDVSNNVLSDYIISSIIIITKSWSTCSTPPTRLLQFSSSNNRSCYNLNSSNLTLESQTPPEVKMPHDVPRLWANRRGFLLHWHFLRLHFVRFHLRFNFSLPLRKRPDYDNTPRTGHDADNCPAPCPIPSFSSLLLVHSCCIIGGNC